MSDLIKRLRSLADCDARAGEPLGKCMREAADEIENLSAALARIEGDIRREILWHLAEASKHRGAQNDAADAGEIDEAIFNKYDAIGHETAADRLRDIRAEQQ